MGKRTCNAQHQLLLLSGTIYLVSHRLGSPKEASPLQVHPDVNTGMPLMGLHGLSADPLPCSCTFQVQVIFSSMSILVRVVSGRPVARLKRGVWGNLAESWKLLKHLRVCEGKHFTVVYSPGRLNALGKPHSKAARWQSMSHGISKV